MEFFSSMLRFISAIILLTVPALAKTVLSMNELDIMLNTLERSTTTENTTLLPPNKGFLSTNSNQPDEIDLLLEKILSQKTESEKKHYKCDTVLKIGPPLKKEKGLTAQKQEPNANSYFSNLIIRQERSRQRNEAFLWPTKSKKISSGFGFRADPFNPQRREFHAGLDISGTTGDVITASKSGTVTYAGFQRDYGYLVILKHVDDYYTFYAHNSSIKVRMGEMVTQGQVIAFMGNTGRSTGTHLHFEIRKNKTRINPEAFFRTLLTTRS
jgi:murein DD-endopeptidase MepM/ murein hydrolase activator NlpD